MRSARCKSPSSLTGFTLVELLVVLGIIILIMGIVLSGQSTFNRSLILANTAYDIALTIRSAETYGISSRVASVSRNTGYGVHFQSGVPNSFIFFADTSPAASCGTPDCKPGDYVYTPGSDTLVQTYAIGNGMTVQKFCAFNGAWACSDTGAATSLDIVFARPNPDAFMSRNGAYSLIAPVTSGCLTLTSPQGGARYISVSSSGAIIANAASCP